MPRNPQARTAHRPRPLPRYAVIMAGGQGTRFWPRSRRRVPKQLLAIAGRRTLLQETVRRLLPLFSWDRILIVTNREQAAAVRRQLPRLSRGRVLVEPVGRNTLPCIALAAEWIAARVPDAVMVVAPADHVIKDAVGLRRTLSVACALAAETDALVTLGIPPTRAETGYGYIEQGARIDRGVPEARWVRHFHEKPAAAQAKRYVVSGRYLWNSGMFVWKTSVFHRAVDACLPAVRGALGGIWRTARGAPRRLARVYSRLPSVSVDVGVVQPLSTAKAPVARLAVVRAAFDWSDVGSWAAMPEVWGHDRAGNTAIGRIVPMGAKGSIVYSPERLVVLIGVNDLVVVDSADALLVCHREQAQDVRLVAGELARRGWSRYL